MKRHPLHRRGYFLLELLFVISLLGTFALISTRLFRSTFNTMRQASESNEIPMRFDAAVRTLRSDIASAASIDIPDARSMIVHDSAGQTIQWQSDSRHEISRRDTAAQQRWDVGQTIEFHKDGSILLIHPQAAPDDTSDIALTRTSSKLEQRQ